MVLQHPCKPFKLNNKYFKFNAITADELNRLTHVRFLIGTKTKRFAIKVRDTENRQAVVFSVRRTQVKSGSMVFDSGTVILCTLYDLSSNHFII